MFFFCPIILGKPTNSCLCILVLELPPFRFGVLRNGAHYHPVVTSNVDAVYDGHVSNHARFN